jgi:hypothetical protein
MRWVFSVLLFASALLAQSDTGEPRVRVTDQAELAVPGPVELISHANQGPRRLETDAEGTVVARRLPSTEFR